MNTIEKIRAEIQTKYDDIPWRDNDCDCGWLEALEWVLLEILDKYAEQEPTNPCDLCKFNTKLMLIEANVSGYAQGLKESPKTGKWDEIVKEHKCYARDDTYTTTEYHCSECGEEPFENEDGFYELSNYCPNCGAKMFEPTCDTCEYNTAAFMPCNACEDKSEYKP